MNIALGNTCKIKKSIKMYKKETGKKQEQNRINKKFINIKEIGEFYMLLIKISLSERISQFHCQCRGSGSRFSIHKISAAGCLGNGTP